MPCLYTIDQPWDMGATPPGFKPPEQLQIHYKCDPPVDCGRGWPYVCFGLTRITRVYGDSPCRICLIHRHLPATTLPVASRHATGVGPCSCWYWPTHPATLTAISWAF